jgi:hypothetical protein
MTANFFDFIFYRIYKKYTDWGESDIPGVYALCVISLFPCLNISSLIFFGIDFFKIQSWNYDKVLLFFCFLTVVIFNYYRIYKRIGLANLLNKWDNMDKKKKSKLGGWMILYFILSIVILFISILY